MSQSRSAGGRAMSGVDVSEPVIVFVADSDPVVSGQLLDDLIVPRFPGAPLVRIASSGHWPHVEQPAQVVEAISRFHGRGPFAEPVSPGDEGIV